MKKSIVLIFGVVLSVFLQSSTYQNQIQHNASAHAYINATMIISSGMIVAFNNEKSSAIADDELHLSLEQTIDELSELAYAKFDSIYKYNKPLYDRVFNDSIMKQVNVINAKYTLGDSVQNITKQLSSNEILKHVYFVSNSKNENSLHFQYVTEMSKWFMKVGDEIKEKPDLQIVLTKNN